VQASLPLSSSVPGYWPSARQFTESIQCPAVCFSQFQLKNTLPAVDRLGMPLVTSGQFAFVYKLKALNNADEFAVRCFRGFLGDRDQRYRAIQRHLQKSPVSLLSDFTYSPEGILVSGNRYPILFMKWIDGPTLDLYIEEMLYRKEVRFSLSQEWLKLVAALREAEIAHGDLQHGNIIVERGHLRLVDHDGLFVPEMAGWNSSELGHQHYQHPLRDAGLFNAQLDNFSAIVIYLTFIALMENPGLWAEHHDENLLFTKSDFANPAASPLFTKIKQLGSESQYVAEVLEKAAKGRPEDVPYLLDLVSINALPTWMTEIELEAHTQTREVQVSHEVNREHPRWIPKPTAPQASVPTTPGSTTVQSIFAGPIPPNLPYGASNVADPLAVWTNTPKFAKELLGRTFIWWYWGFYVFLKIIGLDFIPALLLAVLAVLTSCLAWGLVKAQLVARAAIKANTAPNPSSLLSPSATTSVNTLPTPSHVPRSITSTDPIIGNTALNIYHLTDCEWVGQIPNKNRASFTSSREASLAGYKPCRVCGPKG